MHLPTVKFCWKTMGTSFYQCPSRSSYDHPNASHYCLWPDTNAIKTGGHCVNCNKASAETNLSGINTLAHEQAAVTFALANEDGLCGGHVNYSGPHCHLHKMKSGVRTDVVLHSSNKSQQSSVCCCCYAHAYSCLCQMCLLLDGSACGGKEAQCY